MQYWKSEKKQAKFGVGTNPNDELVDSAPKEISSKTRKIKISETIATSKFETLFWQELRRNLCSIDPETYLSSQPTFLFW